MIIVRTVTVRDPLARANVVEALTGAGAPAGVTSCEPHGDEIVVRFDDAQTPALLVDDLIAIERAFVAERGAAGGSIAELATVAARGLGEPELDAARVLETYLP